MTTNPEQQKAKEQIRVKPEDLESALASGNPEALEKFINEATAAGQREQADNMALMDKAKKTADPELIEKARKIDEETQKINDTFKKTVEGEDFVAYLPEQARGKKTEALSAAREKETKRLEDAKRIGPEAVASYYASRQQEVQNKTRKTPAQAAAERKEKFNRIRSKHERPGASI